jgi:putative ABC transport system permease protein
MPTLLGWLAGSDLAEEILGDLAEQRHRRARESRVAAALWFWQALAGVAFFIGVRRGQRALATWARDGFGLRGGASDLRQAGRRLWRTPWYSVTAVGVTALSLALAATAFAVVDGVLFKPLPYRAPEELYAIAGAFSKLPPSPGKPPVTTAASWPDLEAWSSVSAPAALAAFDVSGPPIVLRNDMRPRIATVDRAFLDVLGVKPLLGGFRAGDFVERPAIRPVLITYALWQSFFEGAMPIVGRVAGPPESRIEVVGVMPRGFVFPAPNRRLVPDLITPIVPAVDADTNVRARWLTVIGRIPAGVPMADITAKLSGAAQRIASTWPPVRLPPNANETTRMTRGPADMVSVRPLKDVLTLNDVSASRIVFGAAAFLVLLSALTVAGLTASRLEDRRSELAVRRALGGSAARLTRLLAAESAVIVLAGAMLGWLAAAPLLRVTVALMPPGLMFLKPPVLDVRVLAFGTLTSAITIAIVTLWASRSTRSHTLSGEMASARSTAGRTVVRARSVLIAAQVCVAVVMVVAGVLLTASLARVWREDPGFNPDRTATIRVDERNDATAATMGQLVSSLQMMSGVSAAAGLGEPFLDNTSNGNGFSKPSTAVGETLPEGISVTGGFFAATGLRAIQGRLPTDEEFNRGDPVLVVSEQVARTYWPGGIAVGQRLKKDDSGRDFEVIGVVPDARYRSLDRDPDGAIYSPLIAERRLSLMNLIVKFDGDAAARLPEVTSAIESRFPMYTVRSARTVTASLGESIRARRFQTWLFAAFGLAALILTGAGILGVMAMTTARRTREVGIRMAIGATRSDVVSHLLREQMLTVSAGLLAGAGLAIWTARYVRAFLYKLDVYEPWVWAAAIMTVLATAAFGTLLPALRASRIDPVSALRVD